MTPRKERKMNYIPVFSMSVPFSFTLKVPMVAAEVVAAATGMALVALPVAAVAAVLSVSPASKPLPLPLPVSQVSETRYKTVDEKELNCLANNISYEARNQSELGQLAVGLVTVTRAKHEKWSKSICGVVHEPKQFSWTWDGKQNIQRHEDSLQYLRALNLASRILYGEFDSVRDMFTADHYHTTKVHPAWANKMERIATIDNHVFYVDQE